MREFSTKYVLFMVNTKLGCGGHLDDVTSTIYAKLFVSSCPGK